MLMFFGISKVWNMQIHTESHSYKTAWGVFFDRLYTSNILEDGTMRGRKNLTWLNSFGVISSHWCQCCTLETVDIFNTHHYTHIIFFPKPTYLSLKHNGKHNLYCLSLIWSAYSQTLLWYLCKLKLLFSLQVAFLSSNDSVIFFFRLKNEEKLNWHLVL